MNATDLTALESIIEAAFENRDTVTTATRGEIRDAVLARNATHERRRTHAPIGAIRR